tara:strand:- start:669 stop:1109 length:441 start_codon:yes stop_codon:yes gene_type:complete
MDIELLYNIFKAFHIIFMTTWMAGLFYLPRLFVYHSLSKKSSEKDKTFQIMEKKLLMFIMNPSLIGTWLFGLGLISINLENIQTWLKLKIILVLFITIFHIYCIRVIKMFKIGKNYKTENFFRLFNEIPTIIFIFIIWLVVFKPFI